MMERPSPEPVDPFTEPHSDELWFEDRQSSVARMPKGTVVRGLGATQIYSQDIPEWEDDNSGKVIIGIPLAIALVLLACVGMYFGLKAIGM